MLKTFTCRGCRGVLEIRVVREFNGYVARLAAHTAGLLTKDRVFKHHDPDICEAEARAAANRILNPCEAQS